MNKRRKMNKIIALCLIVIIGMVSFTNTSFAYEPTIDTKASVLKMGKNQLIIRDYDYYDDILLGCFTVPETGKYVFEVTNNGAIYFDWYILNEDLVKIAKYDTLYPNENTKSKEMSLKKNEKIYFYGYQWLTSDLLAAKINIKQITVAPKLNKSAVSLKVKNKTTLKLLNNKKSIIWVSSNNSVASVSSKGVITAKKKGTAYIYAIANDKLYKCKVTVR